MKKTVLLSLIIVVSFSFTSIAQNAYIQIEAEAGVSVFLDNLFKGKTTADIGAKGGLIIEEVSAGNHTIKVIKDGFNPQEEIIVVKAGEVHKYTVKPFIPKMKIYQSGNTSQQKIESKVGNLLIQSIPVSIVVNIPSLGGSYYKTQDKWNADEVRVGKYKATFRGNNKSLEYTIEIKNNHLTHLLVNMIKGEVEDRNLQSENFLEKSNDAKIKSNTEAHNKESDLKKMGFFGVVKNIKEYKFEIRDEFELNNSRKIQSVLKSKNLQNNKYIKKSWTSKTYNFKVDGSIYYKNSDFKYDENKNPIELKTYNKDGSLSMKFIYKYDDNGNRIERTSYNPDNSLSMRYAYDYNESGNRLSMTSYNAKDGSIEKSFYKYDNNGNTVELKIYKIDGSLKEKHLYKHDERGNVVETIIHNADQRTKKSFKYKFDEFKNWTESACFEDENLLYIKRRKIQYYFSDKHSKIIHKTLEKNKVLNKK